MGCERVMDGVKNIQLLTQHNWKLGGGGGELSHRSSTDWPFNNHVHKSYGAKLDLAHLTKTSLIFKLLEEDWSFILIYLKQRTIQEPRTQFNFSVTVHWNSQGKCDLSEHLFSCLFSAPRATFGNLILCSLLLSAAGNPFHKDHRGEKSKGAGGLGASGPSASGSQSSPPAQAEGFSFRPEELWARAETRQKSSSKSLLLQVKLASLLQKRNVYKFKIQKYYSWY